MAIWWKYFLLLSHNQILCPVTPLPWEVVLCTPGARGCQQVPVGFLGTFKPVDLWGMTSCLKTKLYIKCRLQKDTEALVKEWASCLCVCVCYKSLGQIKWKTKVSLTSLCFCFLPSFVGGSFLISCLVNTLILLSPVFADFSWTFWKHEKADRSQCFWKGNSLWIC